jgi:hypothetical protein
MHRYLVINLAALVACGGGDAGPRSRDPASNTPLPCEPGEPRRPTPYAPAPEDRAVECPYLTTDGPRGANAYIAVIAPSIAEIYRLDLIHIDGTSHLDHPSASPTDDGRLEIGFYASDEALATLCDRGCTTSRRCGVRVVTTKQQLIDHWDIVRCQVERGPDAPPDPTCNKP